jgi:hypothetical protein
MARQGSVAVADGATRLARAPFPCQAAGVIQGRSLVLVVAIAAGCRGRAAPAPVPPGVTRPTATTAPPVSARPLDEADCGRLLDHTLELQVAALRAEAGADAVPTRAQLADIRQRFEAEDMRGCVGAPRPAFDCAMAAPSVDGLARCLADGGGEPAGDGDREPAGDAPAPVR